MKIKKKINKKKINPNKKRMMLTQVKFLNPRFGS